MSDSESEELRCSTPEYKRLKRGESSKTGVRRKQKFREEWENDPRFKGWLIKDKDVTKARCRACNAEVTAELTVIKNHSKSAKHLLKAKTKAPTAPITDLFKKTDAESSLQTQIKTAEIKLTSFLAEHNISFNSADHLTKLLKKCFPDSHIAQKISLGRSKATQITKNVIGSFSEKGIIDLLKENKFSLIIDESTDISSVKTLCCCVRFFHPEIGKILTLFWKLVQIFSGDDAVKAKEGATSQRLYDEIINLFLKKSIPIDNLIGFASDGCNTMFGTNNSVASKLKNQIPGLMVQKCICHSLHLCASEACKVLPRRCEDLARNIYGFFKNSAKRQAMYKEFQIFCNVEPHKLLRPAQTRWLSLLEVVNRILEQWEPLKLFFSSSYLEHRLIASEEIYIALHKKEIKLFYFFLDWVLPKFIELNKYFQSEKVVILNLHQKMIETYKDLLSAFMESNYLNKTELEKIDPSNSQYHIPLQNIYLGIKVFQNIKSLEDETIKLDFLERCKSFLIKSCLEIKKRYNFQDPILSKLNVLNPKNLKSSNCSTLLPLMQSLPQICDTNESVDQVQKIDDQFRKLKTYDDLPDLSLNIDEFYYKLSKTKDYNDQLVFADLCSFVCKVLSLPHSSASCERVFSKVNLIKTKSRNRLVTDTVNGLLLTSQYVSLKESCVNFTPTDQMIKSMTSTNLYPKKEKDIEEKEINQDDTEDIIFFEEV